MNHALPVHIVTTSGGFDSFGWDSLVAIGTIVLALGTAWLAWSTRRLARETGDDVRAEFRPVVVVSNLRELRLWFSDEEPARVEVGVRLQNDGTGPALDTLMHITIDSGSGRWAGVERLGTISAGGGTDVNFNLRHEQPSTPHRNGVLCRVKVTYRDVSDGPHQSKFVFESEDDPDARQAMLPLKETSVRPVKPAAWWKRSRAAAE